MSDEKTFRLSGVLVYKVLAQPHMFPLERRHPGKGHILYRNLHDVTRDIAAGRNLGQCRGRVVFDKNVLWGVRSRYNIECILRHDGLDRSVLPRPVTVWKVIAYRQPSRTAFWSVVQRKIISPKSMNAKIKANVGIIVKRTSSIEFPLDLRRRRSETPSGLVDLDVSSNVITLAWPANARTTDEPPS